MKNEYLERLYTRLRAKYSIDTDAMGMGDWLCANTTLRGKPFSFVRYPFQERIANDLHQALVCEKISQVGLTEVQIRKALAVARRKSSEGVNVMFTLPNDNLFEKVSGSRIKTIIEEDSVFNLEEDAKAIRNKSMYQFGHSFLYVTGATEGDATSTSVDFMFNDEVDLTDQAMLALFASRLQNSDYKVRQQFSTPTFTGYGVNALMALSDYHEYVIKCPCGHWQVPTFDRRFVVIPGLPSSIEDLCDIERTHLPLLDLNASYVMCEKCGEELNLADYENREWVAKHENMPYRGYKVRPFTTHRLSINYIVTQLLDYKTRNNLRGFKNTVLGEADDGGNARLSIDDISACLGSPSVPTLSKGTGIWVGIDMGQICTIYIGIGTSHEDMNVIRVAFCHVDKIIGFIEDLKKNFTINGGAVDRHPYEPTAQEIWKVSEGRIWPVEYRGSKELSPVTDVEKNISHFQVDRTAHLDRVAARIRARNIQIVGYNPDHRETIIEHLRNMVRKEEPEKPAVWEKLDENDHSFHALGFLLTAPFLPAIASMLEKQEVRTTLGLVPVDLAAPSVVLPGFSANYSNSLRIVSTKVYG